MIKSLRRKFIAITMCSLLLILLAIIGLVNGINFYRVDERANHLLQILTENGGSFPKVEPGKDRPRRPEPGFEMRLSEETPFETRYFWAKTDADGQVRQINTSHIAAVTSDQAMAFSEQALQRGRSSGYVGLYKYRISQQGTETLIVFVDHSSQIENGLFFLLVSGIVAAIVALVMFLVVYIFSTKAIRPVIQSIEKQKQFISDAGHELKTPLSIIAANTDVLELQSGKNQWLDSTRNQIHRLNRLVQDLLMLSKMDEQQPARVFSRLDMSTTVQEAAQPFCALAEAEGKALTLQIQPGLAWTGDAELLRQLVGILLDNAVKYAAQGSQIVLALQGTGRSLHLSVRNVCDTVPQGNLNRLFDRFYRAEQSRSRQTGGYGIGLSIAQAIVRLHRGKIAARLEPGDTICFTVDFE